MGPNLRLEYELANKLGPFGFGKDPKRKFWVVAKRHPSYDGAAEFQVSRQCESLSDLEREVERLKRELDEVVAKAGSDGVA